MFLWRNMGNYPSITTKWATAWQNQQYGLCAQRRLISAWASAQSDLSLCWVHIPISLVLSWGAQISTLPVPLLYCFTTYRNDPKFSDRYAYRSSLIRVYTVCHSVCIVLTHYSMVEPHSSNFRVITTNFLGFRIFRKFIYGMYHKHAKNSDNWKIAVIILKFQQYSVNARAGWSKSTLFAQTCLSKNLGSFRYIFHIHNMHKINNSNNIWGI